MKSKILTLFVFAIFVSSLTMNIIFARYQNTVEKVLNKKDKLINKIRSDQTNYDDSLKKYSTTIEKYVNDCSFIYDDKKISSSELITFINQKLEENDILYEKLEDCKDSLNIKNAILEEAKKHYGIKYIVERTDGGYTIRKNYPTKLDSALVLFPHFKDRIKISGDGKNWEITTITTAKK